MKIIKSKEEDTFDKIIASLDYNERERRLLMTSLLAYNYIIPSRGVNKNYYGFVSSLNEFIDESVKINNKEVEIYNKMLRYLQLLLFNDRYYWYTDSYYYDYFEEIIKFLQTNRQNRAIKINLIMQAMSMGIHNDSEYVDIIGDMDLIDNLLSDEIYADIIDKIPTR